MDKLRMTCFKDHLRTTFYQSQSIVLLFIFHSDKYKNTLTTSFTKFVRCNSLTKEMVNDRNTDIKNGLVGFYSAYPREILKYWTPNSNPLIRSNWENFFAGSWVELVVLNGALLLAGNLDRSSKWLSSLWSREIGEAAAAEDDMRCWENDHRLHLVYSQVVAVCPDCGLKVKDGCIFFSYYRGGGGAEEAS